MVKSFFDSIGIDRNNMRDVRRLSRGTGIPYNTLMHYEQSHTLPNESDLCALENNLGFNRLELFLNMGLFTSEAKDWLARNAKEISEFRSLTKEEKKSNKIKIAYRTKLGKIYNADCLDVLNKMENESVDLVFADPPFNLGKDYGKGVKDNLDTVKYERWCQEWLDECIRVLKPGGSLFLWHIPQWAQRLSGYVSQQLSFRHWIAVKQNNGFPISGRLYPAHYALLYFTKGKTPLTFSPDRMQIETCKRCGQEHRDYGGHRNKLNPAGMTMQDIWVDIHPVKRRKNRQANELSIPLLDRVIEMATQPGDVIFDPFGGSGVSYIVAELKKRKWIGSEIGDIQPILNRFKNKKEDRLELNKIRGNMNRLFSSDVEVKRKQNNLWIDTVVDKKRAS